MSCKKDKSQMGLDGWMIVIVGVLSFAVWIAAGIYMFWLL